MKLISLKLKNVHFILILISIFSCNSVSEKEIEDRKILNNRIEVLNKGLNSQQNEIEELKTQLSYLKQDLKQFEPTKRLDELFLEVRNSVYLIRTINDKNESSLGSAFCISEDGIAISNHHVFENASESFAKNKNGDEFLISEIIEDNDSLDYIIFRLGPLSKPLPFIPISLNFSKIGENVFTVGNPKGLEQTLSNGIISGYRDENSLIQTTTEITSGSSGGPLFNSDGDVIGITTSGYREANLNFAINIDKLNLYKYIKPKKIIYDSIITNEQLLHKMSNYYSNLKIEKFKIVESHYNDTLKRFHKLFSVEKNIAIEDHKNYLNRWKIIKADLIPSTLKVFRNNNEYTLQYQVDYQIIRKKDKNQRTFKLKGVVVINSEGKINSIYENILREF